MLIGEDEFSRHSMTCLTRSAAGSSTFLDQAHAADRSTSHCDGSISADRSTSFDQVDFRHSSDVDLRDRGLASDIAAHQADTRSTS